MNKAVFLDRDGTLNFDVGYLSKVEDIYIFDGVVESLKSLKDSKFLNIIVTNQSGIARGYFNLFTLKTIHEKFLNILSLDGECLVDDIFFSPYHKDGIVEKYSIDSNCRKPGTGMIEQAAAKHNIDLSESWLIGDSLVDMQCARSSNLKKVLVKTGYGLKTIDECAKLNLEIEFIAENFSEASEFIHSVNNR